MTRPLRPSLLITLLTVLLIGAFGAGPAAAHSELVSSSPANGSSGPGKPTEVQLTFNEDISTTGLQVVAQGSAGAVALGTPTVSGAVVSAAWPQSAPAGTYTVSYRVVSADGHPVDGSISFTYADLARGSGAPASDVGAPGASSAAAGSAASASASPAGGANATADSQSGSGGIPLWIPIIVVIVGVGIGAGIAYVMRARAGKRS